MVGALIPDTPPGALFCINACSQRACCALHALQGLCTVTVPWLVAEESLPSTALARL